MDEPENPFLAELHWRGLLHQTAGEGLEPHLSSPPRVAYCGFDPTADSLGVGNLVPIMLMRHWQRAGHKPILLQGGATGLIGDPSGKDAERTLMSEEEVRHNVERQARIFEPLFTWEAEDRERGAVLVNNLDWWQGLDYIAVLRDIGKHFSVNAMIQRDSVKKRLEDRAHGISYTEFSYMLLQAYDFLHLRREHDCTLQMSGSDQFGNIVSGMDLIRRAHASGDGSEAGAGRAECFGITAPLLTRADGKKFGKSEAGNVWLTPDRTSPYAFYQFWINASDDDVGRFLKTFTMLAREEIEGILSEHEASPQQRLAQRRLAQAVTADLHGASELASVEAATAALFGKGDLRALRADILEEVFADVPHSTHAKSTLEGEGLSLVDLLPETTLAGSKREARELLRNNAVSVNGDRADAERRLRVDDLLHGKMILLKRGKKSWHASHWSG